MSNDTQSYFLSQFPPPSWTYQCISALPNFSSLAGVWVNENGVPMAHFSNQTTWGITRAACLEYCNYNIIALDFDFQSFATSFTAYLLPWLGLIAQLPTETGGPFGNAMSICLAVGSPALITYSLSITILNRYWVRKQFGRRSERIREVSDMYPTFENRLKYILYFLEEAQQVPLRASQEDGWFSSLVVAGPNHAWWKGVKDRLVHTRRWKTLSFIFQMIVAIIAWLFTVIAAFASSLGDIPTAEQISSGSIWIWMIPVLWGWILVGSQFRPDSIDEAITAERAYKAIELEPNPQAAAQDGAVYTERGIQRGLVIADSGFGLTPKPTRSSPLSRLPEDERDFFSYRGDERERGPIHNYARIFTYCHLIETMNKCLAIMMNNIKDKRKCSKAGVWEGPDYDEQLEGNAEATERYCGLDHDPIYAYPEWKEIPQRIQKGIIGAVFMALFVQWGTAGPAIMIAYLTPAVGLGCRSAGYLVYGTLATLTMMFLILSMLCSHEAMLQVQRKCQKPSSAPDTNGNYQMVAPNNTGTSTSLVIDPPKTFGFRAIGSLALIFRVLGKSLAILNTLWIITISVFEYVGGFDNCWCNSNTPGLGDHGWIVLFKTARELSKEASSPWAMGVTLSILVCAFSLTFFWMGTRGTKMRYDL